MPKEVTPRQQRYLFSKGSPLSQGQKDKMATEMREGAVTIKKSSGRKASRKSHRSAGRSGSRR